MAPALLFQGVHVFDGLSDKLSEPRDVLVSGGIIQDMGPVGSLQAPGAIPIQARGKTLMPGFIDMHVHLGVLEGEPFWSTHIFGNPEGQAAALVHAGVTTVLVASDNPGIGALARDIEQRKTAGPRVFRASSMFTAPGGHPEPLTRGLVPGPLAEIVLNSTTRRVLGDVQARRAVEAELKDGTFHFVKVVYERQLEGSARLDDQALATIIQVASGAKRPVVAHIGSAEEAARAAELGVELLMHPPHMGVLSAERVAQLKSRGTHVVTTARIYGMFDAWAHHTPCFSPLEKDLARPGMLKAFSHRPADFRNEGYPDDYVERFASFHRETGNNLRALHAARIPLFVGTDADLPGIIYGASLHEELRELVALGFKPAEVLRMATSLPGDYLHQRLGIPHALGRVEKNATADLLLVDGDPLQDITATRAIVDVIREGRCLRRLRADGKPRPGPCQQALDTHQTP
jgi:imidazolonepropionase-like amidohydrolase